MGVLDDMTKGITERKAKATGPKLTPVGLESSPTKPSQKLPDDIGPFLSNEAMCMAAKDLRKHAALLLEVAASIDGLTGLESEVTELASVTIAVAKKAEERAADEKARERAAKAAPEPLPELGVIVEEDFTTRLDRLSTEAQVAVFANLDIVTETVPRPAGWTCPDHGASTLKQLESRKGRKYMACQTSGCREFEKE
jgi:hypothetical protein